jgi:hypothetical protein
VVPAWVPPEGSVDPLPGVALAAGEVVASPVGSVLAREALDSLGGLVSCDSDVVDVVDSDAAEVVDSPDSAGASELDALLADSPAVVALEDSGVDPAPEALASGALSAAAP